MKRTLNAIFLTLLWTLACACATPKLEQKPDNEQIHKRAQEASQDLSREEQKQSQREE